MSNKIALINQALSAADSSIKLARQLLIEIESGSALSSHKGTNPSYPSAGGPEKPLVTGVFDGENMVTGTNEKFPVPANYASKSMLVVGDTLKLSDEGGEKRFKQIEHVKRYRTTGILTKKEGKFRLVTPEGSFKVLPASVEHFNGEVGDEAVAFLPASNLSVAYAALESIAKKKTTSETLETGNSAPKTDASPTKETKPAKRAPIDKETKIEVGVEPKAELSSVREKKETKPDNGPAKKQNTPGSTTPSEKVVEIKMPELAEDELR